MCRTNSIPGKLAFNLVNVASIAILSGSKHQYFCSRKVENSELFDCFEKSAKKRKWKSH